MLPPAIIETWPDQHGQARRQVARPRSIGSCTTGLAGSDPRHRAPAPASPDRRTAAAVALRIEGETSGEAAARLILGLRSSYLPIQGPPGAGKTFTGADAILALTDAGRTVGITAPSHAVIHNLLDEVVQARGDGPAGGADRPACPQRQPVCPLEAESLELRRAGPKALTTAPSTSSPVHGLDVGTARIRGSGGHLVRGRGRPAVAGVNTLAVAAGARKTWCCSATPSSSPSRARRPTRPGAGVSALGHVLGHNATMPEDAGLFLDRTYRMHPTPVRVLPRRCSTTIVSVGCGLERQT